MFRELRPCSRASGSHQVLYNDNSNTNNGVGNEQVVWTVQIWWAIRVCRIPRRTNGSTPAPFRFPFRAPSEMQVGTFLSGRVALHLMLPWYASFALGGPTEAFSRGGSFLTYSIALISTYRRPMPTSLISEPLHRQERRGKFNLRYDSLFDFGNRRLGFT